MKYILQNDNFEVVGKQYLKGVGNYTGNTTNASDLAKVINNKADKTDIVTPDWNAQQGEAGYIENKPIIKNFIKEQSMEFNEVDEWDSVYAGYDAVPSNTTVAKVFADITIDGGEHITTTVIVKKGESVDILINKIDEWDYLEISMYDTSEGLSMHVGSNFGLSGTLKCDYYEEGKQLDEDYIPDTVIKTTPQTLSTADKNQALANLGIKDKLDKLVEITYSELKSLRDSSQLIPGQQYRITDYITTTVQENTQSAGHPFDIIVTADDENTLNEAARACMHEGDTYFADSDLNAWELKYCLDNDTERFAWALGESNTSAYVLCEGDDIPDEVRNLIIKVNVSYDDASIDNSKVLYIYDLADDTQIYFTEDKRIYSESERYIGDYSLKNGKGVIYRMIDEWGNDCPYDFKNIQFKRFAVTAYDKVPSLVVDNEVNYEGYYYGVLSLSGQQVINGATYSEDFVWVHTFALKDLATETWHDYTILNSIGLKTDESVIITCHSNVIKEHRDEYLGEHGRKAIWLNNIVFFNCHTDISSPDSCDTYSYCHSNSFESDCQSNTFGRDFYSNSFGNNCNYNTFGDGCDSNSFGNNCDSNSFGNNCPSNSFGNNCYGNIFGIDCHYNSFGDGCYVNSFGNNCTTNSFGNNCNYNTFGDDCRSNSFGNRCRYNSFGVGCSSNSFVNACEHNNFGSGCNYNSFGNYCDRNGFGDSCQCNNLGARCYSNTFGNTCHYNSFGNGCDSNIFGNNCHSNNFGEGCNNNSFVNGCCANTFGNNCSDNTFGDGFDSNIFGEYCYENSFIDECRYNSFGNNCYQNSFSTGCDNNSFGNYCHNNSLGYDCSDNSFGNGCYENVLEQECYNNDFGNDCCNNSLVYDCYDNSFGSECEHNNFGNTCNYNSFGNKCRNNSFGNKCKHNSFGNSCLYNSFGDSCMSNRFDDSCESNSFGDTCYSNSFGNGCSYNSFRLSPLTTASLINYCRYNHFDDGCSYNVIWTSYTTSSSKLLKNINVNRGVSGTSSNYNFININTIGSEQEINVNQVGGIVSIGEVLSIRYESLRYLRDNLQLIPGRQYRIIDYNTTTSQENTTSAGHPFDIIVTAIDKYTLSEEAQAAQNHNSDNGYFDYSNLSAWKIWYSLDNDTDRFEWAGDERIETTTVETIVADSSECTIKSELIDGNTFITPFNFESCVWVDGDGDGVIPYDGGSNHDEEELIYEWGYFTDENDNTQLCLYKSNADLYVEEGQPDYGDKYLYRGVIDVDGTDYDYWQKWDENGDGLDVQGSGDYVFATTPRIVSNPEAYSSETITETIETVIPLEPKGVIYRMIDEFGNDCPYDFKNIQFKRKLTNGVLDTENGVDAYCYTFNAYCGEHSDIYDASIIAHRNVIEDDTNRCYRNVIKEYYQNRNHVKCLKLNDIVLLNTYDATYFKLFHCYSNSFGNNCYNNSFGNDCYNNSFGNDCRYNSFGNNCRYNSFGNDCYNNSFGNDCRYNSFGNNCYSNSFGRGCSNNSFGNNCYENSLGSYCNGNSFSSYCHDNSFGNDYYSNNFGFYCYGNNFGFYCYGNNFGDYCNNNSFGNYCNYNSFGNNCDYNSFRSSASKTAPLKDYCDYNHLDDGCSHNVIWNSDTTSSGVPLKNINVNRGVHGTSSNHNFINIDTLNVDYEIQVAKNSKGEIKIYCEADLIA